MPVAARFGVVEPERALPAREEWAAFEQGVAPEAEQALQQEAVAHPEQAWQEPEQLVGAEQEAVGSVPVLPLVV